VTFPGIYEFQGQTLRISLSRPVEVRPTEFTTEGHLGRTTYTLDLLRDRPDFRLLLMDLAFPAAAFARGE
jgi:hypothetical protein